MENLKKDIIEKKDNYVITQKLNFKKGTLIENSNYDVTKKNLSSTICRECIFCEKKRNVLYCLIDKTVQYKSIYTKRIALLNSENKHVVSCIQCLRKNKIKLRFNKSCENCEVLIKLSKKKCKNCTTISDLNAKIKKINEKINKVNPDYFVDFNNNNIGMITNIDKHKNKNAENKKEKYFFGIRAIE